MTITRSLTAVARIYYLWPILGSTVFAVTLPSNSVGKIEKIGGVISLKDGSALKTGGAAGAWTGTTALTT